MKALTMKTSNLIFNALVDFLAIPYLLVMFFLKIVENVEFPPASSTATSPTACSTRSGSTSSSPTASSTPRASRPTSSSSGRVDTSAYNPLFAATTSDYNPLFYASSLIYHALVVLLAIPLLLVMFFLDIVENVKTKPDYNPLFEATSPGSVLVLVRRGAVEKQKRFFEGHVISG